jgi:formate C-acetyltransferase
MTRTAETTADVATCKDLDPWRGFDGDGWSTSIDSRLFLRQNYTPYEGDAAFLAVATGRTSSLWARLPSMFPQGTRRGVYDADSHTPSTITAYAPGYMTPPAVAKAGLRPQQQACNAVVRRIQGATVRCGGTKRH